MTIVNLNALLDGAKVTVETLNTIYQIEKISPSLFRIKGNPTYCPTWRKVVIVEPVMLNASMFWADFATNKVVRTSTVQGIRVK